MNFKKSALSYWCFPSPRQSDLKFLLLLSHWLHGVSESMWRIQDVAGGVLLPAAAPVPDDALPGHWSWKPGCHIQVLLPSHNFPWRCNCPQEPDPGIILPVMSFTIIISFPMVLIITIYSIPNKWKMLQVFYMGGSKVSLHDAPTSSSPRVASSLHCDVDPGFTFLSWFVEKDCAKLSGSVWTLHVARSGLIGNLPNQWGPGFQKISKFCKTHVKTHKKYH